MSYLVNPTLKYTLQIAGQDYTSSMISFTCSDSSAYKNGLISTVGSVTLGEVSPDQFPAYGRNIFRRGAEVIIEVSFDNGSTFVRHPRGLLYTLSSNYEVESGQTIIEVGCQISLAALTEDISQLLPLAPFRIDPVQQTVQGVGAALATAGQFAYQDNQGDLVVETFFGTDTTESTEPGEWVSVLGSTAMSVNPLSGTSAVPDGIALSYSVPASYDDAPGVVDSIVTESYYFVTYPAIYYVRTIDSLNDITDVYTYPARSVANSSCGNTPPQPDGNTPSCTEGYTTERSPLTLPAFRREESRTEYNGPAGQVSRVRTEVYGPALEANSQFYADSFAFCRWTWATACQPNGECSTDEGMAMILQSYSETLNYYGDAGELVRTITDQYKTVLSAAQPFDWRSGIVNGIPQDFRRIGTDEMYRESRVINDIRQEGNASIQETTTFRSVATEQSGISGGNLDALDGIQTFVRRTSTTTNANPVAPDTIESPQTKTVQGSSSLTLYNNRYTDDPVEAGPYVVNESLPIPLLVSSVTEVQPALDNYSNYLTSFIKGDSQGLVISEALREEIVGTWRPGMPIRYVDTKNSRITAMRLDSCQWGIDDEESVMAFNGVWIGESNGTYVEGSTSVGNPNDVRPVSPPAVINETFVDKGSYVWNVDVFMTFAIDAQTIGNDGVFNPGDRRTDVDVNSTYVFMFQGIIFSPGSLVPTETDGGLPASNNNSILTANATIVDGDLFSV